MCWCLHSTAKCHGLCGIDSSWTVIPPYKVYWIGLRISTNLRSKWSRKVYLCSGRHLYRLRRYDQYFSDDEVIDGRIDRWPIGYEDERSCGACQQEAHSSLDQKPSCGSHGERREWRRCWGKFQLFVSWKKIAVKGYVGTLLFGTDLGVSRKERGSPQDLFVAYSRYTMTLCPVTSSSRVDIVEIYMDVQFSSSFPFVTAIPICPCSPDSSDLENFCNQASDSQTIRINHQQLP